AAGDAKPRSAAALPGRDEQVGDWGPCRGPAAGDARPRSAAALPGRDEQLGVWGPCRGPRSRRRETEERPGSAGARRTVGGLGAMSRPPSKTGTRSRDRWPGSPPRRAVTDDGAPGRRERWEV